MILKQKRHEHNLSQTELAKVTGVSQKSISNYEKGISDPDIETLVKFADYFHITVDSLIGHEVPYLLDKSLLSLEQSQLIDKIVKLTREQCMMTDAYIEGLLKGQQNRENIIAKIRGYNND